MVGVASIDRFDPLPPLYDAVPKGHHPTDYLPDARAVISIAMPVLNPVLEALTAGTRHFDRLLVVKGLRPASRSATTAA